MGILIETVRPLANAVAGVLPGFAKRPIKQAFEYFYWFRAYRREAGSLSNHGYEFQFTDYFGLTKEDYRGKRVCDVGCGPRGSLEWCDVALERVGVDPLVPSYRKLGIDSHAMDYVSAGVEHMPFEDEHFDIVASINSLDHVDDHVAALDSICRILKTGGKFLLITEINHRPTLTEPINIEHQALRSALLRDYDLSREKLYSVPKGHKFFDLLKDGEPDLLEVGDDPAIYTALCTKRPS